LAMWHWSGKNASLGEMYSTLSQKGVRVPDGFALTADTYRDAHSRQSVGAVASAS
jgi:pyruvate, water dikinase